MTDEELTRMADWAGITMDEARAKHAKVIEQGGNAARPICIGCAMYPEELEEFVEMAKVESTDDNPLTPTQFVIENDGTYNDRNGHFLCTECYIKNGMPSSERGWVCP